MSIAVVSGGFDPLHVGHVRLIREASAFGDDVYVILNTDEWLMRKKGFVVSPFPDRLQVLQSLEYVSGVIKADDGDGTVVKSLECLRDNDPDHTIYFCNGGDRGPDNCPEASVEGVTMLYGVGGSDKADSSSDLVKRAQPIVYRKWGHYVDHYRDEDKHVLKTLTVYPGKSTSFQRHFKRGEVWRVLSGEGSVSGDGTFSLLVPGEVIHIEKGEWHQITNASYEHDLVISEYQYGICQEEDIERKEG